MYDFWQFLHVTLATLWVGGSIFFLFLTLRFGTFRDNPIAGPATGLVAKTSVPLFVVASLGTFVTGLIMAFGWVGFGPLWIKIGLAGVIMSMGLGFGYHKPHAAKMEAAMKATGPDDPAVQAMVRQSSMVSVIELAFLVMVIWAMVTKP